MSVIKLGNLSFVEIIEPDRKTDVERRLIDVLNPEMRFGRMRDVNPIQIRRQVVGQRSLERHADGQYGAARQRVRQFDLLSNHVAADRIRREQRDEEVRRPDPAFDLLDPFVADEHLSVNEDVDAPAFQLAFEESGEVLIRADVSVADKDLGHETPHWDLPLKRLLLNWRV